MMRHRNARHAAFELLPWLWAATAWAGLLGVTRENKAKPKLFYLEDFICGFEISLPFKFSIAGKC